MTKRYLVAILALFMMLHTTGCTSGGGQGDGDVAESNDGTFAEEGNSDYAAADSSGDAPADGSSADAPPADAPADGKADTVADNLDDLGAPPADAPPADGAAPTDVAANGAAPAAGGDADGLSLDTAEPLPDAAAADPSAAPPADAGAPPAAVASNDQPPPTDAPVFNAPADGLAAAPPPADAQPPATDVAAAPTPDAAATSAAASAAPADAAPAAPKAYAPYKKMREQAYAAKDGTSLNRVYLARAGDSMKSISQKIYGKNRKKDLVAWNGKSSVTTGDKVYYASPNDANDTTMKTYYEDIGVQPSTYTSKDGDNIRKVSKQLLGSGQSWKEVWATNPTVESKGDIPAGLEIRYWPEGSEAGAAPTMANNGKGKHEVANADSADLPPPPSDPDLGAPPGKDLAMNDIPPPPPTGANPTPGAMPGAPNGASGMNPPPPGGMNPPAPPGAAAGTVAGAAGAAGASGLNPPPPPPPPDIPAPAPPEPKPVAKKMAAPDKMASTDSDPDQMMWLGAGGIMLMAAAVLYVVIKKNRAKRVDLSQTQV